MLTWFPVGGSADIVGTECAADLRDVLRDVLRDRTLAVKASYRVNSPTSESNDDQLSLRNLVKLPPRIFCLSSSVRRGLSVISVVALGRNWNSG